MLFKRLLLSLLITLFVHTLSFAHLCLDASQSTLYIAMDGYFGTVDKTTGNPTLINASIPSISAISDATSGVMYFASKYGLFGTIDRHTGTTSIISRTTPPITGMAFYPGNILYAATDNGSFGTIEASTGVFTSITDKFPPTYSMTFIPSGFLLGSSEGYVFSIDVSNGDTAIVNDSLPIIIGVAIDATGNVFILEKNGFFTIQNSGGGTDVTKDPFLSISGNDLN